MGSNYNKYVAKMFSYSRGECIPSVLLSAFNTSGHSSTLQVGISDFKDRQDLINACMASCHVPLMLDLKVTRPCRSVRSRILWVDSSNITTPPNYLILTFLSFEVPLLSFSLLIPCRGKECVDGSFPDFFYGNCDLLTRGGGAVVFDYFYDTELKRQGRMDMLQLTS